MTARLTSPRFRPLFAMIGMICLAQQAILGCAEHGAMPTAPVFGVEAGDWRRIYPGLSGQHLNAAWGMDADDMWAVGDRGTILRFDGRSATRVESPTRHDLIAIDGCARDEIWAATGNGEILRGDGRGWSLANDLSGEASIVLTTICCPAPDTVLAGGFLDSPARRPCIMRYDGMNWSEMFFLGMPADSTILKIWHPAPGYPLMAAGEKTLFRHAGESWQRSCSVQRYADADGDLILSTWSGLLRLDPDGAATPECTSFFMRDFKMILSSRLPLAGHHEDRLYRLENCYGTMLIDSSFSLRDLIKPVLPGSRGLHVFAVGDDAGFMRLTWLANRKLHAQNLVLASENRRVEELTGDGVDLWFRDQAGRLYRGGHSAWRQIETPFALDRLWGFFGGTLIICRTDQPTSIEFAWAEEDGIWRELPAFFGSFSSMSDIPIWTDHALRPRILIRNEQTGIHELWGLDAGAWTLLCIPAEALEHSLDQAGDLVGLAADDLYLCASIPSAAASPRRALCHFDGDSLREVLPDRQLDISAIRPGQHSRRLYLEGSAPGLGPFGGYLQADSLTIMGPRLGWSDLCEVDADLVVCLTATSLHVLGPQGWTTLPGAPADQYRQLWAHRDQGLFVVTSADEVFHRDLPRGRQ